MKTTRWKTTSSKRPVYEYSRSIVTPVKTKKGKITRRNYKRKTENVNDNYSFRNSSSYLGIKTKSYKISRDDTWKVANRERITKKGSLRYYRNIKKTTR